MLDSRNFSAATGTWSILHAFPATKSITEPSITLHTIFVFFFAKWRQALTLSLIGPDITRVSRRTIVCRRRSLLIGSWSPILRRSSQTHVSIKNSLVGSVVMVGKVELDSSVADHCSRRGQMFPRVCDVAKTYR